MSDDSKNIDPAAVARAQFRKHLEAEYGADIDLLEANGIRVMDYIVEPISTMEIEKLDDEQLKLVAAAKRLRAAGFVMLNTHRQYIFGMLTPFRVSKDDMVKIRRSMFKSVK